MEYGLLGSLTVHGASEGSEGRWMCRVESQEAEIRS